MSFSEIRSKLLKASKMLTKTNISDIKYLIKDNVGDRVLEDIGDDCRRLFNELEKLYGKFTETNITQLCNLLEGIGRDDIKHFLQGTEKEIKTTPGNIQARLAERAMIDGIHPVINTVAQHLTKDWKRAARFLGLPERIIEQIDLDNRQTSEKALKSLEYWKSMCKENSSLESLKTMLEKLPRYDIIRAIEKEHPNESRINSDVVDTVVLQDTDDNTKSSATALVNNTGVQNDVDNKPEADGIQCASMGGTSETILHDNQLPIKDVANMSIN